VFSLSGRDWVSRVRLAGLAGLSSYKAKPSPRADFSLIPQPGLG
jgi:hypothetical protein